MTLRLSFTEPAGQDIDQIYRYIAQDNIAAADRHRERLERRWLSLLDQPRIGTKRDDIKPGLRSVTEGNYQIFYRILEECIEINRVLHAAQDPQRVFAEAEQQQKRGAQEPL